MPPLVQMEIFKQFLDDVFGRKQWWTKELEEERDILAEARRVQATIAPSDQFKQARNRWLRAIRKAKKECWQRFLQATDPDTA
jgi:hypothetical protein